MFGYVQANVQELKLKDYEVYRAYYCGVCHSLHKRYGRKGQVLLNYDMTFLAILLTGLYEPGEETAKRRCLPHPVVPHKEIENEWVDYAADMTILLSYQKALDDWRDEKSTKGRVTALFLYDDYKRLRERYPRQAKTLERCVRQLSEAEKSGSTDLDYVSGLTGEFLAEMFAPKEDAWTKELRDVGFYLGKFIYLMDAYDDMDGDRKKGCYNLMLKLQEQDPEHFEENARGVMVDMMSRSARSFERLPVVYRAQIIRNVLYSGVWVKYAAVTQARRQKEQRAKKIREEWQNERSL